MGSDSAFGVENFNPDKGGGMKERQEIASDFNMTLRDYFAGQALQGLLSHHKGLIKGMSENAYNFADAMLEARKVKE